MDRYGRIVGELFAEGINVKQALVNSGQVRVFQRDAHQGPWAKR